jgi:hypothetical protein
MIKKDGRVKKPKFGVIAKKIRKSTSILIPILFISIAYGILFLFLHNKILFTPDFGESDAFHLNISFKYFLAQNLKQGTFPFWTNILEGGYPLFSEGQIGSLFLPNIIFLKLLPFADAYNALLIFSLLCLSVGFFLFLTELKIASYLAFLYSLLFTFSGAISLRWVHLNLIQSFSLTPLLFYFLLKLRKTNKMRYSLLFSLFLSQMIFAGHVQVVFISLFGLCLWYIGILIQEKRFNLSKVMKLFLLIAFGCVLSFSQLLPTYILSQQTSRNIIVDYPTATSFPLSWSHLISYVIPYALGDPRKGTYPAFSSFWGIFWENTPYIGIPFFLLLFIGIFYRVKIIVKEKLLWYLGGFFGFFILMALGKNSPLYFFFTFPPFNFFRTPPKYLLMANFFLILSGAMITNVFLRYYKKTLFSVIFVVLLTFNIYQLISFAFQYHVFVDKNKILSQPTSLSYIKPASHIIVLGSMDAWNSVFTKVGWVEPKSIQSYLFFLNFLYPNSNLIFHRSVYDINIGTFRLNRPDYLKQYIINSIPKAEKPKKSVFQLLHILGIDTIVSSYEIRSDDLHLIKILKFNTYTVFIYRIPSVNSSFFYIPKTTQNIVYLEDFKSLLEQGRITIDVAAVENSPNEVIQNNSDYTIRTAYDRETRALIQGVFKKDTFVVFRDNYYPEWSVFIDGKKTTMYKTNLVHMGVFVPKGNHTIVLQYENRYFWYGVYISIAACIIFLIIYALKKLLLLERS